jgi:CrcB protein
VIKLFAVGLGGFFGALARYGLSGFVHARYAGVFPLGTLLVNVLGCLVIGAVISLVELRQLFSPAVRLFLTIGLLGSFTTFSTIGYETFELLKERDLLLAVWNAAANLGLGLGAVAMGWIAVRALEL